MKFKPGDDVEFIFNNKTQKNHVYSLYDLPIKWEYSTVILSKESNEYINKYGNGNVELHENKAIVKFQDTKNPEYYICTYVDTYSREVSLAFHESCIKHKIPKDLPKAINLLQNLLEQI